MRIGFLGHHVRQVGHAAGMQRRPAAGEAGQGEIGRAPEEMDRAALPKKAGAEPAEHALDLHQGAPEVAGHSGVVDPGRMVLREGDWIGHLIGLGEDARPRSDALQRLHRGGIEAGDRLAREGHSPLLSSRRANNQLMVDQVELELEGRGAIGDQGGG